jgi:hypothetical protein
LSATELTVGFLVVSIPTYKRIYRWVFKGEHYRPSKSSDPYSYDNNYNRNLAPFSYSQSDKSNKETTHASQVSSAQTIDRIPSFITVPDQIELARHAKKNGTWLEVPDDAELGQDHQGALSS